MMPTVPIMKLMYCPREKWIAIMDMTREVTSIPYNLESLAVALTQQEWLTLKAAIQQPDTWVKVTGDTDKR